MNIWIICLVLGCLIIALAWWSNKVSKLGGSTSLPVTLLAVTSLCLFFSFLYGVEKYRKEHTSLLSEKDYPFRKESFEGHTYIVYRHSFMHDPNCACRKFLLPRTIALDEENKEGKEE